MSANTILSNSQFLQQLSTSLNLITPTTGITVLNSGNNNIATEVVGNTGTVTLSAELENLNLVSTNALSVATFANPFITQPDADGYVLSSETNGALSWVPQSGGGGGITSLQTTDANLTASATSDPAIWLIGLNQDVNGLTSLFANNLACGDGTIQTGLTITAGSGGIDMSNCPIINASFENPFKVAPSSDGQVLSSTTAGALSWVSQGGGGGGIQSLATTDANLTAIVNPDDATQWVIGLNSTLADMVLITTANLLITSSTNPFAIQPSINGQVLACDTSGVLSWVNNGTGGGGITSLQTTNANLTAVESANPAIWEIGLNSVVSGLTSLEAEVLYCGTNDTATGLQVSSGSGGIFMNGTQLGQVNYIGNYSTDPSTVVDIFANWNLGAGSWGGEIYLDETGVYIDTNSSTKNLYYSSSGDLANYSTAVSYPPTTTPSWVISNGGDATLATAVFTGADVNETAVKLNAGNLDMGNNEIINLNQIVAYSTAPSPDIKVRSNVDTGAGTFGGELYMDSTGVYLTTDSENNKLWLGNDASLSVFNEATPFPPISAPLWGVDGTGVMTIPTIQAKTNISLITGGTLTTNNMINPFSVQPTVIGQVLSSDTDGNLSWIDNGSGGTLSGTLISLGGAYTEFVSQDQIWLNVVPPVALNTTNLTIGMAYYIDISGFGFIANTAGNQYTFGIWINGTSPPAGASVSEGTFYSTGSYNNFTCKLQYTVQTLTDTVAVYLGGYSTNIQSLTGCSYTITGIVI